MGFKNAILYLACLSIFGFLFGRILPKPWFRWDAFPYRAFAFERDGKIYDKVKIRLWQNKVPDMSRILPGTMPKKELPKNPMPSHIEDMLRENCVAEFTHGLLGLCGMYAMKLWPGSGGLILSMLYLVVGNVPFIIIQRYNRPRLKRLYIRLTNRGCPTTNQCEEYPYARTDPVL